MSQITQPYVRDALLTIRRWYPHGLQQLWEQCLRQAKNKWKRQSAAELHALAFLLNDILNESNKSIENLEARMQAFKDHIRETLKRSKANYENILSKDVLTVDDVALMEAMKHENYHDVFMGTPAANADKEQYYAKAGERINVLINKYRTNALQTMGSTAKEIEEHPERAQTYYSGVKQWKSEDIQEQVEKEIEAVVPNKETYTQAHKTSNIAEFLANVQANDSQEHLQELVNDFVNTYDISFENLSNNAREKLKPMLQEAFKTIAQNINEPNAVIYVKGYLNGQWKTVKQLTPEEFEAWMTNLFVNPSGGFIVAYTDTKHYQLTGGDNDSPPPAYVYERLHLDIATGIHKDGGNFCKYYYTGSDPKIKQWIREHYQIADHVPTKADKDLMVPCATC